MSARSIWHQGTGGYPVPLVQVSSSLQAEALLRRPEQDIAGTPQQDRQYRQRHRQERLYWRALDQEQAKHDDLECQGRKVYLPGNFLPNLDATGTCQSGSHSRPTCHGQVTQSGDESLGKMQGYLKIRAGMMKQCHIVVINLRCKRPCNACTQEAAEYRLTLPPLWKRSA